MCRIYHFLLFTFHLVPYGFIMKKLLLVIIVLLAGIFIWYFMSLRPAQPFSQVRQSVEIESGMTTDDIATLLDESSLIRSPLMFKMYLKVHGLDGSLQAGNFILRENMGVAELVDVLQFGKADEMSVTIPEGYTLKDIDSYFAVRGVIETGALIDCAQTCDFESFEFLPTDASGLAERGGKLEGYLFPETYFVVTDEFVPKFFLERLLGTFRERVLEEHADLIENSDYSLHDIVNMASLVEEESRTDEERPVVAGILWKRLENSMRLDVDASVRYIVDKSDEPLTVGDLNVDSQYNSRKLGGLPPGPISNPGLESIIATLQPEESPYWYYLHGNDGVIHYAENNEQHNLNKYEYLDKE